MQPVIASKLPHVGTTIFTVMSALAAEHRAINLSQGFPDFAVPEGLVEAIARHLREGRNQYAPMAGVMALREAIADKVEKSYGRPVNAEAEVTVTSGGTEALFDALACVVRPGDEVLLFDPAYDSYDPAIRLNGGRPVHLALRLPDFRVDWDEVEAALGPRTRLIMLNTPHNPSGAVLSRQDLDRLAQLIRERDILVLSDEVYEHLIFDGVEHQSVLGHPELRERSFAIFSFGKTYHATGWKVGYCVAPAALSAEFRKVHQFVTFCTSTPVQHALADYMRAEPGHFARLPAFFQERRDKFCQLLQGSRFKFTPAGGTYFQVADYSAISELDDVSFARKVTVESGVASIPVSVFCERAPGARLVRFCFAKRDETLERAAEILRGL
jgi:methionine aminotransferase